MSHPVRVEGDEDGVGRSVGAGDEGDAESASQFDFSQIAYNHADEAIQSDGDDVGDGRMVSSVLYVDDLSPEAKLRQWEDHIRTKRLQAGTSSGIIPNATNWMSGETKQNGTNTDNGTNSPSTTLSPSTPSSSSNPFAISLRPSTALLAQVPFSLVQAKARSQSLAQQQQKRAANSSNSNANINGGVQSFLLPHRSVASKSVSILGVDRHPLDSRPEPTSKKRRLGSSTQSVMARFQTLQAESDARRAGELGSQSTPTSQTTSTPPPPPSAVTAAATTINDQLQVTSTIASIPSNGPTLGESIKGELIGEIYIPPMSLQHQQLQPQPQPQPLSHQAITQQQQQQQLQQPQSRTQTLMTNSSSNCQSKPSIIKQEASSLHAPSRTHHSLQSVSSSSASFSHPLRAPPSLQTPPLTPSTAPILPVTSIAANPQPSSHTQFRPLANLPSTTPMNVSTQFRNSLSHSASVPPSSASVTLPVPVPAPVSAPAPVLPVPAPAPASVSVPTVPLSAPQHAPVSTSVSVPSLFDDDDDDWCASEEVLSILDAAEKKHFANAATTSTAITSNQANTVGPKQQQQQPPQQQRQPQAHQQQQQACPPLPPSAPSARPTPTQWSARPNPTGASSNVSLHYVSSRTNQSSAQSTSPQANPSVLHRSYGGVPIHSSSSSTSLPATSGWIPAPPPPPSTLHSSGIMQHMRPMNTSSTNHTLHQHSNVPHPSNQSFRPSVPLSHSTSSSSSHHPPQRVPSTSFQPHHPHSLNGARSSLNPPHPTVNSASTTRIESTSLSSTVSNRPFPFKAQAQAQPQPLPQPVPLPAPSSQNIWTSSQWE